MAKMHKATIKKGHKIADAIAKQKGRKKPTSSMYAIGMSAARKAAAKRKRSKRG